MILLNIIIIAALMVTSAAQDPGVSQRCVSPSGKREVNCTFKGHNLEFIWWLNNQLVHKNISSQPADHPGRSTITVEADQSGNLTCEVKYQLSSRKKSVLLKDCQEAAGFLFPYAAVVIAVASFLFLVATSVCFFLLFKMPASQGVSTGTSDADEVTYTDVKIQMGQRKREVHHCTETVEYGQVRVHQQSHD